MTGRVVPSRQLPCPSSGCTWLRTRAAVPACWVVQGTAGSGYSPLRESLALKLCLFGPVELASPNPLHLALLQSICSPRLSTTALRWRCTSILQPFSPLMANLGVCLLVLVWFFCNCLSSLKLGTAKENQCLSHAVLQQIQVCLQSDASSQQGHVARDVD